MSQKKGVIPVGREKTFQTQYSFSHFIPFQTTMGLRREHYYLYLVIFLLGITLSAHDLSKSKSFTNFSA